jgi:hypothetical protein
MATKREKRQATLLADLEYDPQINVLRDAWGQSRTQYQRDLRMARNLNRSQQQVARTAEPKIRDIYKDARGSLAEGNSFVDKALAAAGPGTPTGLSGLINQQIARERGAARNANTAAETSARADLQSKITGAEAGKALAYTTAKSNLTSTRRDLTQKLSDLTGEKGKKLSLLLSGMVSERSAANAKAREKQADRDARAADKAAKASEKAAEKAEKAKTEGAKHVGDVHTATGAYQNKISDAAKDWDSYVGRQIKIKKIDPDTGQEVYDLGADNKPKTRKVTPAEIRSQLSKVRDAEGHLKYTPGDIHIMLLQRVGKPLDAEALRYLRNLNAQGVRIPREWLMNRMERDIRSGKKAGPPAPVR